MCWTSLWGMFPEWFLLALNCALQHFLKSTGCCYRLPPHTGASLGWETPVPYCNRNALWTPEGLEKHVWVLPFLFSCPRYTCFSSMVPDTLPLIPPWSVQKSLRSRKPTSRPATSRSHRHSCRSSWTCSSVASSSRVSWVVFCCSLPWQSHLCNLPLPYFLAR